MEQYTIRLDPSTAAFYERIAAFSGRTPEQVLTDALFKLAGELSLEALHEKNARSR